MKPTTTWILIADGARGRLFANRGPGKGLELLDEFSMPTTAQPTTSSMTGLAARMNWWARRVTPSLHATIRTGS